jgi:hypothetical protein
MQRHIISFLTMFTFKIEKCVTLCVHIPSGSWLYVAKPHTLIVFRYDVTDPFFILLINLFIIFECDIIVFLFFYGQYSSLRILVFFTIALNLLLHQATIVRTSRQLRLTTNLESHGVPFSVDHHVRHKRSYQ